MVLLVAASTSAVVGDVASFVVIFAIVMFGVALDSLLEHRAERAAERLRISVALKEQVLRDGKEVTVAAQELVPRHVVLPAAGDQVPADGRLLNAKVFFVNKALLTGKSHPAEKRAVCSWPR